MSHLDIQTLSTNEMTSFSHTDPEGIAVIMPCIDLEMGQKTAEILLRRAEIPCTLFIVYDQDRQGFVKTLNDTAARLDTRYIVYLAQDAYPGRGWLKCAHQSLEHSGKGLLGFNDGKWQGRIAAFGMVRLDWVRTLYNGPILFPGYCSHAADNELTVIARCLDTYVYNPECTLLEYDTDKDFGGSNPMDRALFRKRFQQGFDNLLSLESLERLAREYKIQWTPAASIVLTTYDMPKQVDNLINSFLKLKLQYHLELLFVNQGRSQQQQKIRAKYASQALARSILSPVQSSWTCTLNLALEKARRSYLFIVLHNIACTPGVLAQALSKLTDQEICAVGLCQNIESVKSEQDIHILLIRKRDWLQLGGFAPDADQVNCFESFFQNSARQLGRNKICLQAARDKEACKLIAVEKWSQK